ncbi:hypothetical protein [Massilia sp. PWRC2]|uniref:hypothetical protein n=1 Tax=Massilia sp. PWRC2 TaxID=2804626 RepID=UPI003CF271E9
MHQEFPKVLYLAGDPEGSYVLAVDAEQEDRARTAGYAAVGEVSAPEEAQARRTRGPNKAK